MTMDTSILREAAQQMRERAECATPGVWSADEYGSIVSGKSAPPEDDHLSSYCFESSIAEADNSEGEDIADLNAQHIASWHPIVALAVADWLDDMARAVHGTSYGDLPFEHRALAVARAYLGESA